MSQKLVSEFFQPRKRQRPGTLKDSPTKGVLSEGQAEPVRKAKRLKKDVTGSGASSASTGVQFHLSKQQVLKALRDSPAKSDTKQVTIDKLKDKLAGYKSAAQNLKSFEAVKRGSSSNKNNATPSTPSSSSGSGASTSRPLATPKSVQRNLFGDVEEKGTKLQKEAQSTASGLQKEATGSRPQGVTPGMSPQKMKESLMKCNNINQLKQRLAGYNNAVKKLKDFQTTNETASTKDRISKPKGALEFEITSPVKTPMKSAACLSPKKTPAYQRFQHLLQDTPMTLTLPYKYRFLKEAFHCLDTVASFLHNRKEIITFKKLKASVQEMLNKNFTEAQLAQIKTVFPFAYIFRREKNLPNHKVTPNNKNKWQLTVEVNTNYEADIKTPLPGEAPMAAATDRTSVQYRKLSAQMLLERNRIFHASLLDILLQHHTEFLLQLEPPVVVDPGRVTRWHPEFPLESVPDVPSAPLPQPPVDETGGTARDVLERARGLFSKYPHLRDTLEAVAGAAPEPGSTPAPAAAAEGAGKGESKPGPSGSQTTPAPAPAPAAPAAGAAGTSRLPAGLLERIRAREAARQQRLITRTPAESRRLSMLGRLPQLARSVRAMFVSERRMALPLETVLTRLADSSRGLSECDELDKHVELLAEEAPHFLQVMQLKSGTFVKMVKDVDVNAVVTMLEKKLQKQ